MSGYRKANLFLVNKLFDTDSHIMFEKVNYSLIDELTLYLKNLKVYVDSYYATDELLQAETRQFLSICRRCFGTIRKYNIFFQANDPEIRNFINFTRRKVYNELFRDVVEPIINVIRKLRTIEENAYLIHIESLIESQKIDPQSSIILIKNKILDSELQFDTTSIRVMSDKEFIDDGRYVDTLIFIGTPSYFDKKFSEVFILIKFCF